MANENDGLYISASLDIPATEQNIKTNDIPKINSDLVSDPKAKIKLNAEVDEIKAKSNIQSQFNSIASKLKLNINSASIDTNKVVEPLRKGFKQLFTEIANTKLVDTNSMAKNVKEMFGISNTKEIKQAYDELKQTIALNPNDIQAVMKSYTALSDTILDSVSLDKELDNSYLGLNKIYNKIFECATAFKEAKTQINTSFNAPLKSTTGIITQFDKKLTDVVGTAKMSFQELFAGTSSKISTNINSTIDDNGIKKVQNFTIQVKSATGEVEKFKYALTNIGDQTQPDFKYVLQNINEADEGVLRLQDAQSKFDSKVQSTITSLKTQAEILKTSYTDSNSSKYVKNQANIDDLNKEYKNTISVIENLKTASNTTFESMKADATSSIEKLRNLINLTNRAENPATSLRKKDIETNKSVYGENIDRLVSQLNNLKSAEPILTILKTDIENVRNALSGVTDASGFEKFLNQFDILDAKAKRLKTLFNGYGSATWFSDNKEQISSISDVSAKAKIYQAELKRLTDEWKSQGIYVDGVKQKASELSRVIGKIKNPEIFEKRTSEFETLVTATKQVKTNLDEQVATYQKIYDLETKITKLSTNPEKNATSIANYSTQLAEQNKRLANLQMQSNAYKNVISLEEQERIVLSAVTKEQEKLNIAKAKSTDTSRNKLEKETASIERYRQKIEKLITTLELLKQANSKAMSGKFDYKLQADSIIAQLQSLQNQENISLKEIKSGFDSANASTTKLRNNLQVTGNTGASVFDTLKEKAVKFASWMGLTTIISAAARQFRNLYENVVAIDTAMVDLKKVTEGTDSQFNAFLTNAIQNAKTLGADVTDIINSTANFSRLGYSLPDATELGRVATLYQNIGDGITSDQASESIISTMKAFGYEADRAEEIIDKFNEVGNNYAISSAGLGEALQRSASALAGANNDLSQSIALQVGANDVIQDPDVVGTMWKTVALRIRGAKTELEDAGLETDKMATTTSQLRDMIKSMTGFDIMENDNKTFKSTYDIIVGIADKWKELDDISQAGLLEKLAGKRQANALQAALDNIDDVKAAYETAQNSAGSAAKEQAEYAKSIQYALDSLKVTFQELSQTVLSSSLVKNAVSFFNSVLSGVNALIDKFGVLGGVITPIVATVMTVKNKGEDKMISSCYALP